MIAAASRHLPPASFNSLIEAVERARISAHPPACMAIGNQRRDSVECRFLINDARSEIERLRRQLAGLESSFTLRRAEPAVEIDQPRAMDRPSSAVDLSVAASARRAYAVAPIGEVELQPLASPEQTATASAARSTMHTVVTNLGSMMDVLI